MDWGMLSDNAWHLAYFAEFDLSRHIIVWIHVSGTDERISGANHEAALKDLADWNPCPFCLKELR